LRERPMYHDDHGDNDDDGDYYHSDYDDDDNPDEVSIRPTDGGEQWYANAYSFFAHKV
jgi:hypothetical protein